MDNIYLDMLTQSISYQYTVSSSLFDVEILNNFLFSFQETNSDMKSREPSTWMTQWAALTSKPNKSPSNEMASPRSNPGKTYKTAMYCFTVVVTESS